MAPIDPHQLLKALSPLLSHSGGIKGPVEASRVLSLMKDASLKMVSKCIYINILKATESQDTLEKFIMLGGWDTLHMWLEDCRDNSNMPLLTEVLKVYHLLPVTVSILKQTNAAKTIKQLRKSDNESIKALAGNIVECWMKKIKEKSNHETKEKNPIDDNGNEKHHRKTEKRKMEKDTEMEKEKDIEKEKSKSKDKLKDKKYDVEKRRKSEEDEEMDMSDSKTTTYTRKEVQPGNGLKLHIKIERTPKSEPVKTSDKHDKTQKQSTDTEKKRASTVKRPHVKPRSTGLEEEVGILPPKKKSATSIDTNKPLPKRPGTEPKAAEPPEKKSRLQLTTPLTVSVPTTTPTSTPPVVSPGEVHQGIKFSPPKPRATRQILESSGFMNAVISSSERTVGQMKKKKKAGGKPPTPTTPPSPVSPTTAMAQRLPLVPSFYKDTLEDEVKEDDSNYQMPVLTKERSPSPTEIVATKDLTNGNDEPVELKNEEENDIEMTEKDEAKLQDGSPDVDEKASVKSEDSSINEEAKSVLTTGGTATKKRKKSVSWAEESKIKQIFYFEMDESERENVNRVKDFGQMKKEEMQMDRRVMDAAKRLTNDKMQEAKPWYRPMLIDGLPGGFEHGKDSTERDIQKTRELGVLQAIFFAKDMLPDSPAEPENETSEPTDPIFIPLEDDSSAGDDFVYDNHPQQSGTNTEEDHVSVTLPAELANMIGSFSGLGQGAAIDPSNPVVANIIASLVGGGADAMQQDEAFNKLKTMLEPLNHQDQQITGFPGCPAGTGYGIENVPQGTGIRPPLLGLAPPGFSPVGGPRGPRFPPPGHVPGGPGGPGGLGGPGGPLPGGPFAQGPGPGPGGPGRGRGQGNGDEWGENMMGGPMQGPPMGPIRGRGRAGMPMQGGRMPGPPVRMMRGGRPRGPRPRDSAPALCRHFSMGSCRFGNACLFLHPGVNGPPL